HPSGGCEAGARSRTYWGGRSAHDRRRPPRRPDRRSGGLGTARFGAADEAADAQSGRPRAAERDPEGTPPQAAQVELVTLCSRAGSFLGDARGPLTRAPARRQLALLGEA